MVYLGPTTAAPLPQSNFWGPPLGTFSAVKIHGAPVKLRCGLSVETSSPQWGQRPATVPKRCHKRNLKATFSDPCASFWAAVANKSALCENPIICNVLASFCVSWRVPFHPQNGLGNAMCTRSFLFEFPLPTSGAKMTPRSPQGRPKGAQRDHKDAKRHPGDIQKPWKNQPATPPGHPRLPGRLQGYPPVRNLTPKSLKNLTFPPPPEREQSRGSDALPHA